VSVEMMHTIRQGNLVKRYHTLELLKEETVGQHCANVAGILIALYTPVMPPADLLVHALTHDVHEQWTGDVPANIKKDNALLDRALYEAEMLWERENNWPRLAFSVEEWALFKFADSLDCALTCLHELRLGNGTLFNVAKRAKVYALDAQAQLNVSHPSTRVAELMCENLIVEMNHVSKRYAS